MHRTSTVAAEGIGEFIDRRPVSALQIQVALLCGLVAVLDGFDVQAIAFAAPVLAREWAVSREVFGAIFSSALFGMLLGVIAQGPIADRVGRKPVIVGSVLLFGALTLATSQAHSIRELMVLRLIGGIGMGAAVPNIVTLTSEYAPRRVRSLMIVLMNSGFPLGGFLGGMLSARLIESYGWKAVFIAGGVGPVVLLPVLWLMLPESILFRVDWQARGGKVTDSYSLKILQRIAGPSQTVATEQIDWTPTPRIKIGYAGLFAEGRATSTLLLWMAFLSSQLLFYFLVSWLPTILTESGLATERAVIATAILNLGSVIGGVTLGWLSDRLSAVRVIAINYLAAALLCFALSAALGQTLLHVAVLAALIGFCSGGGQLMLNALAASSYPTLIRATGMGGAGLAGRAGSIVGPALGGILMGTGMGLSALFGYLALPAVAAAASAAMMWRCPPNPPQQKPQTLTQDR